MKVIKFNLGSSEEWMKQVVESRTETIILDSELPLNELVEAEITDEDHEKIVRFNAFWKHDKSSFEDAK